MMWTDRMHHAMLVVRMFQDMGATDEEMKEEMVRCVQDPAYLEEWHRFYVESAVTSAAT